MEFIIDHIDYVVTKTHNNHAHYKIPEKDSFRLVYVISGIANFKFKHKEYTVESGNVLFLQPHEAYELRSESDDPWSFTVISFSLSKNDTNLENILLKVPVRGIRESFSNAEAAWQSHCPGYNIYIQSLIYSIVFEIISTRAAKEYQLGFVNDVIQYINRNYMSKLTLDMLAEKSGYSTSYFKKKFTESTGISPMKYLNNIRLERAKDMLKAGLFSVGEVSEACGFDNIYYFSNTFKKHFGVSPKNY
ncbi:MAG: AraC family transcriptional regulator [Monoglobaceae bacterium]